MTTELNGTYIDSNKHHSSYIVFCGRDYVGEEAVRLEGAAHKFEVLLADLLWRLLIDCLAELVLVDVMGLAGKLHAAH